MNQIVEMAPLKILKLKLAMLVMKDVKIVLVLHTLNAHYVLYSMELNITFITLFVKIVVQMENIKIMIHIHVSLVIQYAKLVKTQQIIA